MILDWLARLFVPRLPPAPPLPKEFPANAIERVYVHGLGWVYQFKRDSQEGKDLLDAAASKDEQLQRNPEKEI